MHFQPVQLSQAARQHAELLRCLLPLGCRFAALGRNMLHTLICEVADDLRREDRGEFLDQASLDSKLAEIVNERLQRDLDIGLA